MTAHSTDTIVPTSTRRPLTLALLSVAAFMVILDASIVIVAIPDIEHDLGMSVSGVQWVISAYAATFGGLQLLGGRCADVLGRRAIFLLGTVLFTAASLACGLAGTAAVLLISRAVQGVSAAIMLPTALSILLTLFPDGAERRKALGLWGAVGGIGGTAGALIGGPLTQSLGWPWIFFLNVPVGVVLVLGTLVLIPADRTKGARRRFDAAAALSITAALVLGIAVVSMLPGRGWSPVVLVMSVGAIGLAGAFVRIERRSSDPLIPLQLFTSGPFIAGLLVIVMLGIGAYGAISFLLTQYTQVGLGFSAERFGVIAAVNAAAACLASFAAQRGAARFGTRAVAVGCLGCAAAACLLLLGVTGAAPVLVMICGLALFGIGLGAGTVTGSVSALLDTPERYSGAASGVTSAAFQIGGAVGIAGLSTVFAVGSRAGSLANGVHWGFLVAAALIAAGGVAVAFLLRPMSRML